MIENYSFGQIIIKGQSYSKDVKICGEKIVHPWWRREGHMVDREDVKDVLEFNPVILVLGQGKPGMMKSSPDLRDHLQDMGIYLVEEPSEEAVKSFNQYLQQGKKVCAGLHLTC